MTASFKVTKSNNALKSAAIKLASECWPEYSDGHYGQLLEKSTALPDLVSGVIFS